ncbi:MSMEG_4193 family putative phosphomutase [Aldersonia sp. NBC_00410]|uniref:histidine phosphatase family protein n=1 Tax=Aldersonia sp. NBC_00410 TaxID=2975954 RepID=UPI00225A8DC2|nr:histidine phosphatase family protein [Aldersonia sp. NBC_00410]MCX5045863.1 MSMEG_4193 family putative phosphomutase [Aldersonia sp. NBC_00410]
MTVILLRHGVSTSNVAHTLAGRSPGVELDVRGQEQALAVAERLSGLPVDAIVRSPLLRCEQTVAPLAEKLGLTPIVEDRLAEVDYGDWTGRELKELLKEPLWKVVQRHASGAVFPGGEGLAEVQIRAVAAIREYERRLAAEYDRDVLWVACTHGDVIKSVLADALGIHLDGFQRIVAEPASISVVRYTPTAPFVWRLNDTGTDLAALIPKPKTADEPAEGVPGGEVSTSGSGDNGSVDPGAPPGR